MLKINVEGIRAKQYRFFHSKKLRGFNFLKLRNELTDKDDLSGLNELITEYLVEDNEMDYTSYIIFTSTSYILLCVLALFILLHISNPLNTFSIIVFSIIFFVMANKKKNDFILGEVGIEMSNDYFKQKIKEKYNF